LTVAVISAVAKIKFMKKIFTILLLALSLSSCEKDDICDETVSTTPRVVIEFYDAINQNTPKNITNLKIVASGFTTALSGTTGVNKIKLPLQTDLDATTWQFIANGLDTDATNDNEDVLNFTYSRETIYISRACGYKVVFDLNNTNTNLVAIDGNNWIDHISIIQTTINNEDETHIKIYF
jgi:hypothetical protein